VIERSIILTADDVFTIDESWLPSQSVRRGPQATPSAPGPRSERELIETALAECRGRVAGPSGAAAKLRVPPSTLDHRIKALGIDKARFKFQ
jgi:DNA-binding NtrC family response regulator